MMDDLLELLDQRWNAGDPPTFYQLEDLYRVRHGGPWDRMGLVAACRYLRLMDLFDEAFWSKLLSQAKHPRSEEHTSELQLLMRISYAVFCLKKITKFSYYLF